MVQKYEFIDIHQAVRIVGEYLDELSYNRYATYEGDALAYTFVTLLIAQGHCQIIVKLRQYYVEQLDIVNQCVTCLNNKEMVNVSIFLKLFIFSSKNIF